MDAGSKQTVNEVMAAANLEKVKLNEYVDYYKTPAGWLAKYLDKTGPDKLYDGTNNREYQKLNKQ